MNLQQLSSLKESIELLQIQANEIKEQLLVDYSDTTEGSEADFHLDSAVNDAEYLVKQLGRSLDACTTIQAAYNSALSEV